MSTTASAIAPVSSSVDAEIGRIRALLRSRRWDEAAAAGTRLAMESPANRDVAYLLAIAQRLGQRPSEALATLERLERSHPRFSRLYQERGHCHVALRDAPRAIAAYRKALEINGTLSPTWAMLEGLYRLIGDSDNAALAAAQTAKLKSLAPAVLAATNLYCDGDLLAAEKLIRAFLIDHSDDLEGMRLLARIGADLQVYDDAEVLLGEVLRRSPNDAAVRHDYVQVLLARHKYTEAREHVELLLNGDPANRVYLTLSATTSAGLGNHGEAIRRYRALLHEAPAEGPESAELHLSIAHALKTLGKGAEAIEDYRAAARTRPDLGDAYWSLANLKTYRFTDSELESMRGAEAASSTGSVDRYHLCFALGKTHEDRGDYAESWRYYERGNALKRAETRYRPEVIERNTAHQKEICSRNFFEQRRDFGAATRAPMFVVGLPRSGSTLIEQILASHSEVEGTQELADVPRIVLDLQGRRHDADPPRYPAVLQDLSADDVARLAERYLKGADAYRSGKPRFIDKMPNNFRHLGLIQLMFPNSKIIDVRREPMACCFGNLKQLFARGQEFAYSIEDIARYYRTYLELMEHWDAVLPGRVLRVHYEDVVDGLGTSVRRLLDFCELPFEPACVEFHRTERSVRTASSEQVRLPIFREGLDQWRHYETWLEPLQQALGDARVRYR